MDEKKNIGQLFDRIADTYDKFNHLLSLNIDKSWRRRTVRKLFPVKRILDVAVGTGDLALEILRKNKAEKVIGIDLSTEMMKIAARKAEKAGLSGRLLLQKESALEMPYLDECFEAVTCAYGVRNFSDLDQGLKEMFRVMMSGGQLMILEFSYPTNKFVRTIYDYFFTNIMPKVGKLISKDPAAYTYFRESVKNFIWGEEMLEHIRNAGFENVSFKTMTFGITTLYMAEKV